MAQRQFRNDDTNKWLEGYGDTSEGNVAPVGTTTDDQPVAACNGSLGAPNTLNYSSLSGSLANNDILFIIQAVGTDAVTEPNWELNKVVSFDGSTITLKYPLTRAFNSGAQVYVLRQHLNWTLNGGAVINARTFNGTIGGFFVRLARNKIYVNTGTIDGRGRGLSGGGNEDTGANPQARAGASPSNNSNPAQSGPNEGGGGGARDNDGGQGASGGGAGNATNGNAGGATSSQTAGAAGLQITKSQGKILTMGPGGGGGIGPGGNDNGGVGGDGSATVYLIAPDIELTSSASVLLTGEAGNTNGSPGGSQGSGGGGGASGDFFAKGIAVKIGTGKVENAGGVGGASNSGNPVGGTGSRGYCFVDYVKSVSGAPTDGSLSSRQDSSMVHPGGSFLGFM